MNLADVVKLLSLASAYDNRRVTEETAQAWLMAINATAADLDFGAACRAIVKHFAHSGEYLTIRHVIEGAQCELRLLPEQVQADVRAAKAYRLIGYDWPERDRLPERVRVELERRRAARRAEATELGGNYPAREINQ